ncbi:MAG TPA: CAP domain-containing protein [Actinobacteria bacterium]|nr:CAP domain-containing protein [Actinomycetota bacterium]
MRRRTWTAVTTLVLVVALVAAPAAASEADDLVALMNAERRARGLSVLEVDGDLVAAARAQAGRMAARGTLFHDPDLGSVTTGWDRLGENVGSGDTIAGLHAAFMASASHRRNVLGDFDRVGVGVVRDDAGVLWVAVVFMKRLAERLGPPPETLDEAPSAVAPPAVASAPRGLARRHRVDPPVPVSVRPHGPFAV